MGPVSHLPHVIASSLVHLVKDSDSENGIMKMIAAGGFKDITRQSHGGNMSVDAAFHASHIGQKTGGGQMLFQGGQVFVVAGNRSAQKNIVAGLCDLFGRKYGGSL